MSGKKIKILFLDHVPFIGGAQLSLVDHLKTIDKNKFEVIFGCSAEAPAIGLAGSLEKYGIKYKILAFARLKSPNPAVLYKLFKDISEIRTLLKKEKFDLIFANTVRAHILSCLAAFGCRAKVIWFMQDFTFPVFLFKILKRLADKVIYISAATAAYYREKAGPDEIVHIGSDFYKQRMEEIQVKNKKAEWGVIGEQTAVIGYVGRLVRWKGADLLIKALPLLLKQGISNFKCVIIGSGCGQQEDNEGYLKRLVKENRLEDKVIFTGHRSDIPLCMSALDILCLTSLEPEPFGLVIVEAMMAKTLAIATGSGGPAEIIKNGQTGFLVSPSPTAFSQALKIAITGRQLRERMVVAAYGQAVNNFTAQKMTDKFEKIYLSLLS